MKCNNIIMINLQLYSNFSSQYPIFDFHSMLKSIKFRVIASLIVVVMAISCTKVVYNQSGFGGSSSIDNQKVIAKNTGVAESAHKQFKELLNGDTLREGTFLSEIKLVQRNVEVTALLSNPRKYKEFKLLQPVFVKKYGNWIRENIPQTKNKINAILKGQNNNSKKEKSKANYNEDVVNVGLTIAGISAGIFLLIILLANSTSNGGSESSTGCIFVMFLLISGFGIIGGLITALIGALI